MKRILILIVSLIFVTIFALQSLYAAERITNLSMSLYEYALERYKDGDIADAIHEARKALMADSGNIYAKNLLDKLLGEPKAVKEEAKEVVPPKAVFELPPSICVNQELIFDATKSYDPEKRALTYLWDFGDGSTSNKPVVPHKFEKAGQYNVKLTVRNDSGLECDTSVVSRNITVVSPPNISLVAPLRACLGIEVAFDASGSSSPDGANLTYIWDFGDGSPSEGQAKATHIYNNGGDYVVSLIVDDARQTLCSRAKTSMKIHINTPPTANAGPNFVCCVGKENLFDASGSSDPDSDKLSYEWDFGDGSTAQGEKVTHQYTMMGKYTVTLKLSDGSGCESATDSFEAHVSEGPVAVIEVQKGEGE